MKCNFLITSCVVDCIIGYLKGDNLEIIVLHETY